MAAPFDHISSACDSVFTRSAIGQLQRKYVWSYLEKIIPQLDGLEMLELNCGTGDDAMLFSERGFNLVATDVTGEMLKITQQKAEKYSFQRRVSSQYMDLETCNEFLFDKKFDLIFSNFGGLNCVNPESMQKLLQKIPSLLNPKGRFIGVIMPKFCLWESLYYVLKFKFRRAFRRWTSGEVMANFQGGTHRTWYYEPSQIKGWAKENFKVIRTLPVGLALPPTYLDTFFLRKKGLLTTLNKIEKKINHNSLYSGIADHFIIDLQLK